MRRGLDAVETHVVEPGAKLVDSGAQAGFGVLR